MMNNLYEGFPLYPKNKISPTHEIYIKQLTKIEGIYFTHREIDIIACLLNFKRPNEIAQFLFINKKTVSHHIGRIKDKLGVGSREQILAFISPTENFAIIKDKYIPNLFIRIKFEEQLRHISQTIKKGPSFCCESHVQTQKNVKFLVSQIKRHLNQVGIPVREKSMKDLKSFIEVFPELNSENEDYIIYIIPKDLAELHKEVINTRITEKLILENKEGTGNVIFLQSKNEDFTDFPEKLKNYPSTLSLEGEEYYFSIFKLLKKNFPNINIDNNISTFEKICKDGDIPSENEYSQGYGEKKSEKNKNESSYKFSHILKEKWGYSVSIFLICLLPTLYLIFKYLKGDNEKTGIHNKNKEKKEGDSVRSDLPIPTENALLKRPELIVEIERKLKEQEGIQKVALIGVVGIGGVGKTTIARQFGRSQNSSIIWEINAETKNSLINSFKDLAYELAKNINEKNELNFIQDIKDQDEKEKQIFSFVKEHLKENSNWLLIYDNVESYSSIKNYFPHDPAVWGKGNVIITTRDSNIKNNSYIKPEYIIQMGELSQIEALTLFSKIYFNCDPNKLDPSTKKETLNFLQYIPSFPLDTTIAAYYLKETKIPYSEYLEHIKKNSEEFINIQMIFLENIGDYVKTRYGIITLSLRHLINSNPDFKSLLFFISLLDSQNIPKSLLKKYKNELIVEDFIHNLKKYSLITNESSGDYKTIPSLSIHRSTQHISLCYLTKPESLKQNEKLLHPISITLENYIAEIGDTKNTSEIKLLLNHGTQFLSHRNILNNQSIGIVSNELGIIYYYMGNFLESFNLLEESYKIFKHNKKEQVRVAKIALYMGAYYRLHIGDLNKARKLTEDGLEIYEKHYGKNHPETVKALMYSALVHRCLGNYKEAKDLLERSINIYKKNFRNNKFITAEFLVYLGRINIRLGFYLEAKNLLEQALLIFKEKLGEEDIEVAWTSVYLAEVYSYLGYHEKEKELLEKSRVIYKKHDKKTYVSTNSIFIHLGRTYTYLEKYKEAKDLLELGVSYFKNHFGYNDFRVAWALTHLGNMFMRLGDYKEARHHLQDALNISKKHYGKNHIETARILLSLGQNYYKEGNIEIGRNLLTKSLNKFQQNYHPDAYKALEALAETLLVRSNTKKSNNFESIDCLKQALEIVEKTFSKDSPHRERIQNKLQELR